MIELTDPNTVGFIAFICLLVLIVWKKRKRLDREGLVILYRTRKFLEALERAARISPRAWKILATIGIIVSFWLMFRGLEFVFSAVTMVKAGLLKEPALKLVLPAPVKGAESSVAFVFLPWWIWVLVVFFIMFPHEVMHGIIARVEKIKLKSVGLLLFLIFPGAFVEPDEKNFKKKPLFAKLRVLAAGSFANAIVSLLAFFLAMSIWNVAVQGVVIEKVIPNTPAEKAGIKPGEILKSFDGKEIKPNFWIYSSLVVMHKDAPVLTASYAIVSVLTNGTFRNYAYKPGEKVKLCTNVKCYEINLSSHPQIKGAPFIGIEANLGTDSFSKSFLDFLCVLSALSFAVAVINMLPIYPLDGGQMIREILEKIFGEDIGRKITIGISLFVFMLLLYTVLGPVFG